MSNKVKQITRINKTFFYLLKLYKKKENKKNNSLI